MLIFVVALIIGFCLGFWACWSGRSEAVAIAATAKRDLLALQSEVNRLKAVLNATKR